MLRFFIVRAEQSDPIWIIVDLFFFPFSFLAAFAFVSTQKLMHKKHKREEGEQASNGCNRIVGTKALPMG